MSLLEVLAAVFVLAGAFVMLIGAGGVVRFPDFYSRLHAAGKGDTLGQALVLLGLVFVAGSAQTAFKLVFIVLAIMCINPTATHALARSAWVIGLQPWRAGDDGPDDGSDSESGDESAEPA